MSKLSPVVWVSRMFFLRLERVIAFEVYSTQGKARCFLYVSL